MAGTTPVWALPYPQEPDNADVPVDIHNLCLRLETILTQLKTGAAIPGEIKAWSGSALPSVSSYGTWVWADGAAYSATTYPLAAGNIATAWKTFGGAADPGAGMFRVPDLRGLVPMALDQMPGGTRANRMTRAVAITLAGRAGEEYHTLVIGEAPSHSHTVNSHSHGGATGGQSASHTHGPTNGGRFVTWGSAGATGTDPGAASGSTWAIGDAFNAATGGASVDHYHGIPAESPGTNAQGGGASHENVPPTVFIPYIVKLDN